MATKRWPDVIVKENPETNEIYFYREGVIWKGETLKKTKIDDNEIPQNPFDYFEFPSRLQFRK